MLRVPSRHVLSRQPARLRSVPRWNLHPWERQRIRRCLQYLRAWLRGRNHWRRHSKCCRLLTVYGGQVCVRKCVVVLCLPFRHDYSVERCLQLDFVLPLRCWVFWLAERTRLERCWVRCMRSGHVRHCGLRILYGLPIRHYHTLWCRRRRLYLVLTLRCRVLGLADKPWV